MVDCYESKNDCLKSIGDCILEILDTLVEFKSEFPDENLLSEYERFIENADRRFKPHIGEVIGSEDEITKAMFYESHFGLVAFTLLGDMDNANRVEKFMEEHSIPYSKKLDVLLTKSFEDADKDKMEGVASYEVCHNGTLQGSLQRSRRVRR